MSILKSVHGKFIALITVTGLISWAVYRWAPQLPVTGVEIGTVYALGLLALLVIILVMTYSLRKRVARGMPGRLDSWLWAHLYLGVLTLFIIALHAEFRFGWNYASLATVLLALVIITGVIGRFFYTRLPSKIVSEQEKVFSELDQVTKSLNVLLEGKSRPFQKIIGSELNTPSPLSPAPGYWDEIRHRGESVSPEEAEDFENAVELLRQKAALEAKSVSQVSYRLLFKTWLSVHILVTLGLVVFIPVHVLDDTFRVLRPSAGDFSSAEECRQCHQRQYDEWIGSMHAYAQVSPVFEAFNERVKNMGTGPFCVQCHTPIGIEIGEKGPTPNAERADISLMGVQCDACHTIEKNYGLVDGRFPLSEGRTKYGPFGSGKEGDPKPVRNSFHRSVQTDAFESSEYCGACHDVVDDKDLRIEEAFTEWKESPYAEEGVTCQDCHMRSLPGVAGQAKMMGPAAIMYGVKLKDRPISDHSFIGVDNHLIDDFPYPDNPEENARIQRTYLEKKNYLLQNCAEVEIIAPDKVAPSSDFDIEVKVTNTGAGHGIPTGFTAERQVWIEIIVKDADGNVLFVSGDLDTNKDLRNNHSHAVETGEAPLDEYLVNFQSKFIRGGPGGVPQEVLLPTRAFRIEKNNILPYQSKSGVYPINVPADAKGPLSVDVRLRYRNLPPYLLDFLGIGELKDRLVINDMVTVEKKIPIEPIKTTRH
jgi:hypothetical protein